MRNRGCAEADKPGVGVERREGGDDEAYPGERTADQRGHDRAPVPAAVIGVSTFAAIQIAELETLLAHQPVVGNQHAGDRAESAGVADEPREDVPGRIREQAPRLHQYADDSGYI